MKKVLKNITKSIKGFTLIELLGTIVIIGIVGTIAVASVLNIKTKSNERFNNAQVETIKQAGQTYFTDNKKLLPVVIGQTNYVALEELIEKNYIDKVYDSSKNEFKTGNDPNGIPYSYVWVKKVSNKEYQYGVHCTDSKNIVYGEKIQEAKKNTSDVKFVYNGFYEPKNKNMIYTSGNNDNTYVEIKITNDNIEKYKYEIYRKTQSGFSQYKTSTNDIEVSNTKIRINANDYEEGEYYIRVTTYNQTSQTKIKDSDKHIYLDKTVPECSITSNYETVRNSEGEDWYSSNSKYNGTRLGENKKLPLKVKGTDKDSGIKKVTLYTDSSLKRENKKLESNAYKNTNEFEYSIGNTKREGNMYYEVVEDNVGNQKVCPINIKVDTTPPTCTSSGGNPTTWVNANSNPGNVVITGICSKEENSGCAISNVSKEFTDNTNDDYSPGTIADRAGNATVCPTQKVKIDKTPPTCESTGGSENWVNSSSANKSTTLIGKCSDVGSGCVAGNEAGKTYDSNGNVNWLINWEGNWTELSPGTVYDAAGNATECPENRTVRHDWTPPTCTSSGGSNDWVNSYTPIEDRYTTLIGECDDNDGSGCTGDVSTTITEETDEMVSPGTVYDAAGNSKTCEAQPVKHDWTAPLCNTSGGIGDQWTNQYPLRLSAVCSDPESDDKKNSGCAPESSKVFYWDITENIDDNNYNFATIEDNAGNITECLANVHTDYTAPSCTITATTSDGAAYNGNWVDADVTLTGKCEDEGGSGCIGDVSKTYLKGNKNNGYYNSYSYNNSNNSTSGDYSPGTVFDNAGNSTKCDATTVRIDSSTPTLTVKMQIGSKKDFAWQDDPYGKKAYKNGTWVSAYVDTKATANCGKSGCDSITYTTTGATSNDTDKKGNERHINAQGISKITYKVCKKGDTNKCVTSTKTIKLDRKAPTCTTTATIGNSSKTYDGEWINKNVKLQGSCADQKPTKIKDGKIEIIDVDISGCKKKIISKTEKDEGKRDVSPGTIYDKAGNSTDCTKKNVQIDKTAPKLSATEKNEDNKFSKTGCDDKTVLLENNKPTEKHQCILNYSNSEAKIGGKYRGVELIGNNETGKANHSPFDTWGAQAKYKSGGECAWGSGTDYKWNGENVCSSTGSGKIKRCYKVKDKAGNESERVCTCQDTNGNVAKKDPKDCFK